MENSYLVVVILLIPVILQILLPLAMLVAFFLLRLLAPIFSTTASSERAGAPTATPQPQKL